MYTFEKRPNIKAIPTALENMTTVTIYLPGESGLICPVFEWSTKSSDFDHLKAEQKSPKFECSDFGCLVLLSQ